MKLSASRAASAVCRTLYVPIGAILGIYARENGQGMVFDLESPEDDEAIEAEDGDDVPPPDSNRRVKAVGRV
jgi:stringent starvation protein B